MCFFDHESVRFKPHQESEVVSRKSVLSVIKTCVRYTPINRAADITSVASTALITSVFTRAQVYNIGLS